jgi:hypothetical protein
MLARVIRSLAIVAALAVAPSVVRAQDSAVRMEIKSVGDSTFTFNSSQIPWVARGQNGIVVDPRRRDVLVARFKVLTVESGTGSALILGQTQPVSIDHVALLRQPRPNWFTSKSFWIGVAGGFAGGFIAGKAF